MADAFLDPLLVLADERPHIHGFHPYPARFSPGLAGPLVRTVEPLVQPLDRLGPGEAGRIVYVVPKDAAMLVRLANLGVVPGAVVRLQQRTPAAVIRVGETTLAVEPAIAGEIYVKRTD